MTPEINNSLTEILTKVSDLQANLLNVNGAEEALEELCGIRKTALSVLEQEGPVTTACREYRKALLNNVASLAMLINSQDFSIVPDSTLFRIAAHADVLATSARIYMEMRNSQVAERAKSMLLSPTEKSEVQ